MSHRNCYSSCLALLALVFITSAAVAESLNLKYLSRYDCQDSGPKDHLMGVETVFDNYALVSSNLGVALVDLSALPPEGTQAYLDRLTDLDAYTTTTRSDGYSFVNLRLGGFAVVYADPVNHTLSLIKDISEPGVYFEKMAVVGDRLYVAAHAYGIRIYDLTNPASPTLVGSLEDGFDDAFAIAVSGNTAYVADGAGGLKIVDLTDESTPMILAGEDPISAAGTSEDVLVIHGDVYVAAGGVGVAVYIGGDISTRTLYDTPICAKHLAHTNGRLVVADIGGIEIFTLEPDGSLAYAARERGMRRSLGPRLSLRLWHCVSMWGDNRILATNWDSMDAYELVDPMTDNQPDIIASTQRLRFAPAGGAAVVNLVNAGSGPLVISDISSTASTFSVDPRSATLQPGGTMDLTVTYLGGQPGQDLFMIQSNDPDEDPLPIQVFGETDYIDPGEPAVPFSLESWTLDRAANQFELDTFDLDSHDGKIVFLQVFGTW